MTGMLSFAETEAACRQLFYTYARATDRLDRALLRTVFHDDAVIELGSIYKGGPDGFLDVAVGFMGSMAATRHDVANVLVRPDGPDGAAIEAYVTAWHRIDTPDGTRVLTVLGRYISRAERRGGRWALVQHAELMDWGEDRAADAGWFEGNAELPKGRRDRDDGSYAVVG